MSVAVEFRLCSVTDFPLFSLLNDSLQSTSHLRKGIAVVHGCLAEVILDCGICTVFKKNIHTIDVSSSNCVV